MKVVVTVQHPAHVHFFRNAIAELRARGHRVFVFGREADVAADLLEAYGIDHEFLAPAVDSLADLLTVQLQYERRLYRRAKRIDPDVLVAIGEPAVTHVATLLGCRSILFSDTEHSRLQKWLSFPLADRICTPDSYGLDVGDRQVSYPGFHELAYLHPDRFEPDPEPPGAIADTDGPLAVVRLVAWRAAHDVGRSGIGHAEKLVDALERGGATVVLSAEQPLPPSLADRRATIPPERMHDLLFHADCFVGESGTMAIESALLGTPALFVSPFSAGVLETLERRYGLLFRLPESTGWRTVADRATALLAADAERWERRRRRVLEECVDTTAVIVDLVERSGAA